MFKSVFTKGSLFIIPIVLFISNPSFSQNTPSTQVNPNAPVATVNPIPSAYSVSAKINFTRSWKSDMPEKDPLEVISTARTVAQVKRNTQYLDGIGRPIQEVNWKSSSDGFDLVKSYLYDEYGREMFQYLPYGSTSTTGELKVNSFFDQNTFYNSLYNSNGLGEKFYYAKNEFESSPKNHSKIWLTFLSFKSCDFPILWLLLSD